MLKLLLISLFSVLLLSQNINQNKNPKPFSKIGNIIYDNVNAIETLKQHSHYKVFIPKIKNYVEDVKNAKNIGFMVEKGEESKSNYLKLLRTLIKTNDYFFRAIEYDFIESIKNENFTLFDITINSGLLDIQKNKVKILQFYKAHKDELDSAGVVENLLNEEKRMNSRKNSQKTKKQLREEKIQRVRKNDALKQKELEDKLSQDVKKEKEKIRKVQEKELFN